MAHNATARIIRSNQSLVLQKVNRYSAGEYACSALNTEGETVSNQLSLRVKCKYFKPFLVLFFFCFHLLYSHYIIIIAFYEIKVACDSDLPQKQRIYLAIFTFFLCFCFILNDLGFYSSGLLSGEIICVYI